MQDRHRARLHAVPKHVRQPGPWAQLQWRLLGMVFITALLLASVQLSPSVSGTDQGTPAGDTSRH